MVQGVHWQCQDVTILCSISLIDIEIQDRKVQSDEFIQYWSFSKENNRRLMFLFNDAEEDKKLTLIVH